MTAQRWWAWAALVAMLAALVVIAAEEGPAGLKLMLVGLLGLVVILVGGYLFLARRGFLRWLGPVLVLVAAVTMLVLFIRSHLLLDVVIALVLIAVGMFAARHALQANDSAWMPTRPANRPKQPFMVMNPHSGGGKVERFDLKNKAESMGAEVALLTGPGHVDVSALVRDAVARGADLIGVAGGDGTQALVAAVCVEHDIPLLVISAGTRNHFALDLGLDREDPATCLTALTDGEEVRVDLGMIDGRPFVNNASFGGYAEIVQRPEYRDHKERTILSMLPDVLDARSGTRLTVRSSDRTLSDLQAILVSNNPYGSGRLTDLGRRNRLDQGVLGVVAGRLASTAEAVGMLRRAQYRSVVSFAGGTEVTIESAQDTVPVGIDGEALMVPTPVRCTVQPKALRVVLPRVRPGVPAPKPNLDWRELFRLAFSGS